MKRIYVASSWRNYEQPTIVYMLQAAGFEVYDFRNPAYGDHGFHWAEIDLSWQSWSPEQYVEALHHPIAVKGFEKDMEAMLWADTFVLVLPCGRSAHLELGWAVGMGKRTVVLMNDSEFEPELMYRMVDHVATSALELLDVLGVKDDT